MFNFPHGLPNIMFRFLQLALLATIVSQTVFHPCQYEADDVFPAQIDANRGIWQRVTGPASWLLPRLWYDEAGGYWEVQEGSPKDWIWTPIRDGDMITIDGSGVIRIKNLK
jgi:hypothetical protein